MSSVAFAQDDSSPFRFLKPWIEERLFGEKPEQQGGPQTPEPPDEATAPATEAAAPPESADDSSVSSPPETTPELATANPPSEPPAETAPSGSAAPTDNTAAPSGEPGSSEMSLRGTSEDDAEALSTMATEAKPEPLRFGLLAGRSAAATLSVVGKIGDDLSAALGRPVELLPFPSYDSLVDAQSDRRIDGGFFSAAAFALADTRCTCIEPLVAPRAEDGTVAYFAVIAIRANAGIAKLADLAGKTVAIGREDSIGTRRAQLSGLIEESFDPATAFGTVLEVDSAETAVQMVAEGRADAAFAWSSLAGDIVTGYTRGTFANLVSNGALGMDSIAILWRSRPIGHSPFALLRTVADADKEKIRDYLIGLAEADPAAYDALNPFYSGGYEAADAQNYGALKLLLAHNVDALHLQLAPAETGATTPAGPASQAITDSAPADASAEAASDP